MAAATTTANGYLTSTNWNTFNEKANVDNPAFTGIPTAPTAPTSTSNTQIATTAFVQTRSLAAEDLAIAMSIALG